MHVVWLFLVQLRSLGDGFFMIFIFVGYPKDAYPPPGHAAQGYPPQGYPPPQGYAPQYGAAPPPKKQTGLLEGWYVSLSFFAIKESGDL
jgi:hypothetical protein